MNDTSQTKLLEHLARIAKIDASRARMGIERKKLDQELAAKVAQIRKIEADFQRIDSQIADKKAKSLREEKILKEEQRKLDARREALTTLGSFKLQQAGAREIDAAARLLSEKEEALIAIMDDSEGTEKAGSQLASSLADAKKSLADFEEDRKATLVNFDLREKEYMAQRAEIVPLVDAANLKNYERIQAKYPTDPMSKLVNNGCSVCNMQVGPQVAVTIHKGDVIARCPGCGRILFHDRDM